MSQSLSKRAAQLGLMFLIVACFNRAFAQQNSIASLISPDGNSRTENVARPESRDSSGPTTILASFVAAENRVRDALNQHTFKRDVVLQTIGPNGEITGEYIRNSQFLFDDHGRRIEKVLFHPASTIHEMRITREDIQDLAGSQLLGIDIVEATKYRLSYVGLETMDSRQLFAIDVAPLTEPDPKRMSERYFVGRVWVDPTSFQIVKIKGVVEPQGKQRFPIFETWREPIKSALAFPTRTQADDVLHFGTRDVHYRIRVSYYEYKLFGSKVSVTEVDGPSDEVDEVTPKANEAPPKTNQPPLRNNEPSPQVRTQPKLSEKPASQLLPFKNQIQRKPEVCTTNRNAPPVGGYHWPADSEVKVYFVRDMFTPQQSATLLEAMKTWTVSGQEDGSGVRFVYAGETERRMGCRGCLTVGRREVYKQDKHHYAFFNPMQQENGLLLSAWIDLDVGIQDPNALQGFMAHELGHGLGLWDCPSCKKKQSLMNSFPGLNKNNGLIGPSGCDLATMRSVYKDERQVASTNSSADKQPPTVRSGAILPITGLEKAGVHSLDLESSLIGRGAIANSSGNTKAIPSRADPALTLPQPRRDVTSLSMPGIQLPAVHLAPGVNLSSSKSPGAGGEFDGDFTLTLGRNKSSFYVFDRHYPRVHRSVFLWDRRF
jgi:hypothetical protein